MSRINKQLVILQPNFDTVGVRAEGGLLASGEHPVLMFYFCLCYLAVMSCVMIMIPLISLSIKNVCDISQNVTAKRFSACLRLVLKV